MSESTAVEWVQTHRLSTYANNLGWCSFNDVLGAGRHSVSVFADVNYQKQLGVIESRVSIDNLQIPAQVTVGEGGSLYVYWFDVSGHGNQHYVMQHVQVALDPPGQGSQVFICVYQYQAGVSGGEFDLVSPVRPVETVQTVEPMEYVEEPVAYHESSSGDCCCVIA